jgi:ribonuclease BN (tRNA processing enzyme)
MLGDLSQKSSMEFQDNVRKWITSPGERIDMWSANISVDPQVFLKFTQQGSIHIVDPYTSLLTQI